MRILTACILIVFTFGCESPREVSSDERVKLYNDVLDQVVSDNLYQHCVPFDKPAEKILIDFQQGKINQVAFDRASDSLKTIRKNTPPPCVISHAGEFQIFRTVHEIPEDIKASIVERLKDEFTELHFDDASISEIADSISRPSPLDAKALGVSYLDIVPYVKRENKLYGDGIGVFALSKVYFNFKADKGILFYEFTCGPKCGMGEVVFIEKVLDDWKVVTYKRVWES